MATTSQHLYTFLFTDIRTNKVIAELPVSAPTYGYKLSDTGEMSGSFNINDEVLKQDPLNATVPGRTGVYVIRDGIPVWGGMVWGRQYSVQNRQMTINAETFDSYFNKRFQRSEYHVDGVDQFDMARWLIKNNNIDQDILMDVSTAMSGVTRQRNMYRYEYKTILEEFTQLANLLNGFDWEVRVYKDNQTQELKRRLEFYYPQKGLTPSQSHLVFDYPGNIQTFDVSWDAKEGANIVYTLGAGTGYDQLVGEADDYSQLSAGWPKLEISRSYTSVTFPSTLNSHASSILKLKNSPITIYSVTIRPDIDPPFGSYSVGDWATFNIEDPLLGLLNITQRITEMTVAVDTSGLETITLTLSSGEEPIEDNPEDDIPDV